MNAPRCYLCRALLPSNRVHFAAATDVTPCRGSWRSQFPKVSPGGAP